MKKRYCFAHHAHHDEEAFDGRDTKCRAWRNKELMEEYERARQRALFDICLEDTGMTVKVLARHLGIKIWRVARMASGDVVADQEIMEKLVALCMDARLGADMTSTTLARYLGLRIVRTVSTSSDAAADRKLVEELVSLCRSAHLKDG
jgi:hypothetical protein